MKIYLVSGRVRKRFGEGVRIERKKKKFVKKCFLGNFRCLFLLAKPNLRSSYVSVGVSTTINLANSGQLNVVVSRKTKASAKIKAQKFIHDLQFITLIIILISIFHNSSLPRHFPRQWS